MTVKIERLEPGDTVEVVGKFKIGGRPKPDSYFGFIWLSGDFLLPDGSEAKIAANIPLSVVARKLVTLPRWKHGDVLLTDQGCTLVYRDEFDGGWFWASGSRTLLSDRDIERKVSDNIYTIVIGNGKVYK